MSVCVYEKALDWDWMARRLDWIARYHHLRSPDFFYISFVVAAFVLYMDTRLEMEKSRHI